MSAMDPGPKTWGGNVLFIQGKLDTIGLDVGGLAKPLGTTGAFLDSVNGSLGNLTSGDNNWFIKAGFSCYAGCPIPINGQDIYPIEASANGTFTGAGYIEINGDASVFSIPVGGAYFRYNPPYTVAAGAYISFLDILLADSKIEISPNNFSGEANGKLQIPRYVPIVGGYTFASASAGFNNNGFRGSVTINVIPEIPSVCTPPVCVGRICVRTRAFGAFAKNVGRRPAFPRFARQEFRRLAPRPVSGTPTARFPSVPSRIL